LTPAYPHCSPRSTSAHHAGQPRADGFDAHRPRRWPQTLRCNGRFLCERARGGVGLIVTGGFAPNIEAGPSHSPARWPRTLQRGGTAKSPVRCMPRAARSRCRSCTPGAYGYSPLCVAPSRIQSPISPFTPRELSERGIERQIRALRSLRRAGARGRLRRCRGDGQRGLPHQPVPGGPTPTNRSDRWGGHHTTKPHASGRRDRARVREAVGADFILIYRISLIDLIPDGSSWPEVVQLAKAVTAAGATILNTGIGWHEARVPTTPPRCHARRLPGSRRSCASNCAPMAGDPADQSHRNQSRGSRRTGARGCAADMVSLARPFLADPAFVAKAAAGPCRRKSTPALPATRPASITPSRIGSRVSGQPACRPRDHAGDPSGGAAQANCGGRCRASRLAAATTLQSAATRCTCSIGGRDRRPVQPRQAHSGQGGVPRNAALLRAPHRAHRRGMHLNTAGAQRPSGGRGL